MFTKNKDMTDGPDTVIPDTVIGPGASVHGGIEAPGNMRVDGSVQGDCECAGCLAVGEGGRIEGNIKAQYVFVSGTVMGNISAFGEVTLTCKSKVDGDITARALKVDEGACFEGHCQMAYPSVKDEAAGEIKQDGKDPEKPEDWRDVL